MILLERIQHSPPKQKLRLVFGFGTQLAGQVSPHLSEPLTRPTELTQTPSPRGICAWGSLEEYLRYIYIYYLYIHISYVLYKYCVWSISTSIIWIYDLVHRCIYIIHMYNICVYRYLYKANTCTYGSLITLTTNVTYARTACLFPFHFRHGPQIATLAPLSDDFHPDFWPRNSCAKNVKQMSVQTWEPFQTMWKNKQTTHSSFFSLGQKKPSNPLKKKNNPEKKQFISPKNTHMYFELVSFVPFLQVGDLWKKTRLFGNPQ